VATETDRSPVRFACLSNSHSKPKGCARVLTSAESIAFLEEKQHKKQEELGTEAKNAGPKGKICKGEDHKGQRNKYSILQKLVFSIVSCQKMNMLFVLDYMKRIQSQLSG